MATVAFSARKIIATPHRGFALVATLFAIVLISLGAAYFASRVDTLRENAFQTQRWAETEREAFSIRETLQHAAATHVRDVGGLIHAQGDFPLDARAIALSPTLTLRVQDERGLIALNTADEALLSTLFNNVGIPAENHARMIDGLRDYIDADDLKHLNGAEQDDYSRAGKTAPTNDFLRVRDQLADVMGWETLFATLDAAEMHRAGLRERFLTQFTTARHIGVNVNSAPASVLRLTPGIDPLRVGALLDQRRARPFANISQLLPYANAPLDEELVGLVGADTWRVSIAKAGLPFLLECQLVITPGQRDRPTRIKECRRRSPDIFAEGDANEFALSWQQSQRSALSANVARPLQRTTNETNFAASRLDNPRRNDAPAPRWLVEAIATTAGTASIEATQP